MKATGEGRETSQLLPDHGGCLSQSGRSADTEKYWDSGHIAMYS